MTDAASQRLFVAIWPDREVRAQLENIQAEFRLAELGRLTPSSKFHITLQFLGDVPVSEIDWVERSISALRFDPFSIQFDLVGSWPRNMVAWVGSQHPCTELNRLVQEVRRTLSRSHRRNENFTPHVTLARRFGKKIHAPIEPIHWQANRVDLVRPTLLSEGAKYESIAHSG